MRIYNKIANIELLQSPTDRTGDVTIKNGGMNQPNGDIAKRNGGWPNMFGQIPLDNIGVQAGLHFSGVSNDLALAFYGSAIAFRHQ